MAVGERGVADEVLDDGFAGGEVGAGLLDLLGGNDSGFEEELCEVVFV